MTQQTTTQADPTGAQGISAGGTEPPLDVLAWLRANAVSIGAADTPLSDTEAHALENFVGDARVLALGEHVHGTHEPLVHRNRLIRFVVEHLGFSAIALETGFAGGRRIDDYIGGGPGDPADIARECLNWGFGNLSSNVELLRWLRNHNAKVRDPIAFNGADVSGGDAEHGFGDARRVLDDLIAFLSCALPDETAVLCDCIAQFAPRFTQTAYATYTPEERIVLSQALGEAAHCFEHERSAMVAATSRDAFEWAAQELVDALRLVEIFAVWPPPGMDPRRALLEDVSTVRDRTMADHVLWALERAGSGGRVVCFAHNGHVGRSSILNDDDFAGLRYPAVMGECLRAALGSRYRILAMASAVNGVDGEAATRPTGTIERAFAAAGVRQSMIDIREVADRPWWNERQTIGSNFGSISHFVPGTAVDGILLLDSLTLDPPSGSAAVGRA
jgi:erythromycin esterase